MLPPREMNDACLRCHHALAKQDTHCPACGADASLERAVAAQLVPTIDSLRKWLGGLGVLQLALAALTYDTFRHGATGAELGRLVLPGLVSGVVFLVLAALAARWPLFAAVVASAVFGIEWVAQIVASPVAALAPGLGLALRVVLTVTLVTAVRSALQAVRLRRSAEAARRVPVARVAS